MMKRCQLFLLLLVPLGTTAADNQSAATEEIDVSASQMEPIPVVSETTDAFVFNLEADAQCPDSSVDSALHIMVADTVRVVPVNQDTAAKSPIELTVPAAQLAGLQRSVLCDRAVTKNPGARMLELPGAFSAQVALVCVEDQAVRRGDTSLPLAITIDCGEKAPADAEAVATDTRPEE